MTASLSVDSYSRIVIERFILFFKVFNNGSLHKDDECLKEIQIMYD